MQVFCCCTTTLGGQGSWGVEESNESEGIGGILEELGEICVSEAGAVGDYYMYDRQKSPYLECGLALRKPCICRLV